MRYQEKIAKKNVVKNTIAEVTFLFAMSNEKNTLINEFFSIYVSERFNKTERELYKSKYIARFVDGNIEIIGLTGRSMKIDNRDVYKYVNEKREEFFYYDLDFSFMDRMLIDGGDDLVNKIIEAKSIKIASYMNNIGYRVSIIDRIRKKYKMEEDV